MSFPKTGVSAMGGEVDDQQGIGLAHLLGQLIHIGRRDHIPADKLHVAQPFLKIGQMLLKLGELLGRTRQVKIARAPGVDLVHFDRWSLGQSPSPAAAARADRVLKRKRRPWPGWCREKIAG